MILIPCLLLIATCAMAAPTDPATNLALNRPVATNVETLPGWRGLVDGDRDSDSAPGCFATTNAGSYPKYAVIDLGSECTISKVVVHNSANGNTRTVSLACSADGMNYKKLRDPDYIFPAGEATVLSVSFQPRSAKYVRVTLPDTWKGGLGGDNCLFLREVEVYGWRTAPAGKADPFALAAHQSPSSSNRSVEIFKRYCLDKPGELRVTVVGDLLIAGCDQDGHWARVAAEELQKLYPDKRLVINGVGGAEGAIAYGMDWANDHRGGLAPDVIVLCYGTQAALANASTDDFRVKYQALIGELAENTRSLIVALTPLPLLPPITASSQANDAIVEQVALANDLPVLRVGAVLAKMQGDRSLLYADSTHLSPAGHRAVGLALADLLR